MSSSGIQYETGVTFSQARLPEPPAYWSFSALKRFDNCPLQYALLRAAYDDLWAGKGYPPLPNSAALFGNVVHGALEVVVKALTRSGVDSPHTAEAADVLRGVGGLTNVVEKVTADQLSHLDGNPRLNSDRRRRIARELQSRAAEARVRVQTILSRTSFVYGKPSAAPAGSSPRERRPVSNGSHAEVLLLADELRVLGRIDLLTIQGTQVQILDYKTGVQAPDHPDQMLLYALLWARDRVANPVALAVSTLTLAYGDKDVRVDVPTTEELEELAAKLQQRVAGADAELARGAPRAMPSGETCAWCPVRQLCAAYWQVVAPKLADVAVGEWFDHEAIVGKQNGQRSWWAKDVSSQETDLLIRTSEQAPAFHEGDRVRILGIRRESDKDVLLPVATLSSSSEIFIVTSD